MITYTLIFLTIFTVSEVFYPSEDLLYLEDDGTYTRHDLPRDTIYDENNLIRYEIFDIYGW